jgi:hypothetical protein
MIVDIVCWWRVIIGKVAVRGDGAVDLDDYQR